MEKEEEIGQEKANKKGYSKRKKGVEKMEEHYTPFFIRIPNFFWASIFLKIFGFEPQIILKLFLNFSCSTQGVNSP